MKRCWSSVTVILFRVVAGDQRNVKIATSDDLALARATLGATTRVGSGLDLHRLVAGRPLVLAGIVVWTTKEPNHHSDGDVLCHSLVDAMLGAVAAGDQPAHFPNTQSGLEVAPGLDFWRVPRRSRRREDGR